MPELTISGDKGVIATIDINPENGVAVAQGGNDWCPRESIPMPTVGPDIEETLRFLDG